MNTRTPGSSTRRPVTQLWRRWGDLTADDRRDTLRAAVLLPVAKWRLGRQPVKQVIAWAQAPPVSPAPANADHVTWTAVHATGRAAAYGLVRGNCLTRSLTLLRLLRERGIAADLCLGTRMAGDRLAAHAWVELNGVALNDPRGFAPRFARLPATPAREATLDTLTRDAFR